MVGTTLNKLKDIIHNKVVLIMLHGKSIEQLEQFIIELKDLDICYTSLNYFDIMEEFILSKINRKLDFVYDSSSVQTQQEYDGKYRIPRLTKYLSRENNLWVTTLGCIRNIMIDTGNENFILRFLHKTLILKTLNINVNVPSSTVLLIGACIIGEAKKIIICGLDGCTDSNNSTNFYYKKELYSKHHQSCYHNNKYTEIHNDTNNFEKQTPNLLQQYCNQFHIKMPKIYNCSINSLFNLFPKIRYENLKQVIQED